MKQYLDIVEQILTKGVKKENRTGIDTYAISGTMFQHDMSNGFPLLTTKKVPYKNISSELEFFIKGITDKKWLQYRNNHIWDEWCTPTKVPYGHDDETKKKMSEENDLGPIYGFQWRHFGADYTGIEGTLDSNGNIINYDNKGIDQLKNIVDKLKNNPTDRRMIVSAWEPKALEQQALPPCHYGFQVTVIGNKINLSWNQRSVDVPLGLPFNIASYATLLHLLAKESKLEEGTLTGFLQDTHIYENQIEGVKEQIKREPKRLPEIVTEDFSSIFNWEYTDTTIKNYNPHAPIKFQIAI